MIYDYLNRPVTTQTLTQELAAPSLAGIRSVWDVTVASGLTPYRLAGLLQRAAEGEISEYLTLAEEMEERDLHYRCEISKRKLAVASLPITVEAASDEPQDVQLADEVRVLVKQAGFRGLLKDLLDAIGKGFSVCEILWSRGARWRPVGYEWRDPRFFTFDRASRRRLRLLDEQNVAEGIDLAPFKFICHLPHLKTGIPIRGGIARVAAWAWMCKNYTVKDWLAFAEVFGMPLRVGKYQPGASKEDIAILKAAVANLGSDAAAVIPESMLIEFVESAKVTGGHELFNKLADWLDAQVSRGILGQTATTQGTAGKLGNEDAQAEVREDIRDDDATQLSETINRDLVRPFIDLNWGPQEQYPELLIKAVEPEDTQLLVTALEKLVPLGLKVEQSVVRDKLGLPDPEEGADCLGTPPPAEQPAAVETADKQPVQPEPVEAAKNSRELDKNPLESTLLQWVKTESAGPAANLITRAESLLEQAESLEQFREQLIDLLADSQPEQLGEIMARLDLLGNLAGRLEVAE